MRLKLSCIFRREATPVQRASEGQPRFDRSRHRHVTRAYTHYFAGGTVHDACATRLNVLAHLVGWG